MKTLALESGLWRKQWPCQHSMVFYGGRLVRVTEAQLELIGSL